MQRVPLEGNLIAYVQAQLWVTRASDEEQSDPVGGKESGEEMLDFTLAATPRFKKTVA